MNKGNFLIKRTNNNKRMMCFSLSFYSFFPYFRFSVEKNKKIRFFLFITSSYCWSFSGAVVSFYWVCALWARSPQTHSFLYAYYAIFPAEKSSEDFLLSSLSDDISLTRLHMHKLIHGRINKYYYHFYHTYPVIIELLL